MNIIVAGIGTEVGKTVVSAILCEALQADYWKPVQAGSLDNTDSHWVQEFTSDATQIWPEAYRLSEPMSPHAAAEIDDITISLNHFQTTSPSTNGKPLVIELAGGLLVPLSDHRSNIDLVQQLGYPVVLVANYYLGSINHSLLSLALLKDRQVPLLGMIFNGRPNAQSKRIILQQAGVECLGDIAHSPDIERSFIQAHAEKIRKHPAMARL